MPTLTKLTELTSRALTKRANTAMTPATNPQAASWLNPAVSKVWRLQSVIYVRQDRGQYRHGRAKLHQQHAPEPGPAKDLPNRG